MRSLFNGTLLAFLTLSSVQSFAAGCNPSSVIGNHIKVNTKLSQSMSQDQFSNIINELKLEFDMHGSFKPRGAFGTFFSEREEWGPRLKKEADGKIRIGITLESNHNLNERELRLIKEEIQLFLNSRGLLNIVVDFGYAVGSC